MSGNCAMRTFVLRRHGTARRARTVPGAVRASARHAGPAILAAFSPGGRSGPTHGCLSLHHVGRRIRPRRTTSPARRSAAATTPQQRKGAAPGARAPQDVRGPNAPLIARGCKFRGLQIARSALPGRRTGRRSRTAIGTVADASPRCRMDDAGRWLDCRRRTFALERGGSPGGGRHTLPARATAATQMCARTR
jgi:hypothetical protein